MLTLLYFASLRDRMGRAEERVEPPAEIRDAEALLAWLVEHDPAAEALCHPSVRLILNDELADRSAALKPGDQLAFCPPFSGG